MGQGTYLESRDHHAMLPLPADVAGQRAEMKANHFLPNHAKL